MMRDKYTFYVDAEEAITTMFWASATDHKLNSHNDADMRCAIVVFCNEIQNFLMDHFNITLEEGGE